MLVIIYLLSELMKTFRSLSTQDLWIVLLICEVILHSLIHMSLITASNYQSITQKITFFFLNEEFGVLEMSKFETFLVSIFSVTGVSRVVTTHLLFEKNNVEDVFNLCWQEYRPLMIIHLQK